MPDFAGRRLPGPSRLRSLHPQVTFRITYSLSCSSHHVRTPCCVVVKSIKIPTVEKGLAGILTKGHVHRRSPQPELETNGADTEKDRPHHHRHPWRMGREKLAVLIITKELYAHWARGGQEPRNPSGNESPQSTPSACCTRRLPPPTCEAHFI